MSKATDVVRAEKGFEWLRLPFWLRALVVVIGGSAFVVRVIDLFYTLGDRVQDITFAILLAIVLLVILYGLWARSTGKLDG